MFRTSTFDSFSLFLLYTCVPIVGVVNVILLICLSNFKSNFSAIYNPMSMSLISVSSIFNTSDTATFLLLPSISISNSIASEFMLGSTPFALNSVTLYFSVSYINTTKYSPLSRFKNSYFPFSSVVIFLGISVSESFTNSPFSLYTNITCIFGNNVSVSSLCPFLFASNHAVPDILYFLFSNEG